MFSDTESHWARECINQLVQRSLVSGYPDGRFRPEVTITRAEFATLLPKVFPNAQSLRNTIAFPDVPQNNWAYKVVQWAYQRGFFSGYPDGTFKPAQPIPRVQAIGILAGGLKYSPPKEPNEILKKYFDDAQQIPPYAVNSIAVAVVGHLVVNYPAIRRLRPTQPATRAEVAALICQTLKLPGVPLQYIVGEFAIAPQFDEASSFSQGLARVKVGNKYGYIDQTGKFVIQPIFDGADSFFEGMARVRVDAKWGYIDQTGKFVISLQFDEVDSFSEGLALIRQRKRLV